MADSDSENDRLLSILEAHGNKFLDSFDLPASKHPKRLHTNRGEGERRTRRRKVERDSESRPHSESDSNGESEQEEWRGFSGTISVSEVDDETDEIQGTTSHARKLDEIVFSDPGHQKSESSKMSRSTKMVFMSSKVSRLTSNTSCMSTRSKKNEKDEDDERTHAKNDLLLRKLVHTRLLSGSLRPELDLTHAQREKALAGRVLEISGTAQLGGGEKAARKDEKARAGKKVRDGLERKKVEREKKAIEEAKNLGNYHPSLKKILGPEGTKQRQKRERGMGMGVGKFKGGMLRLSKKDIGTVSGS